MATAMLRNLMPSKSRSSEGCWTCRLRRKKCDERRPICDNCGQLEINCLYSDEKPEWMDNGPKQAARAEQVKAEVKEQARVRREKKHRNILQPDEREKTSSASRFLGLASANHSAVSVSALHHSQKNSHQPPLPPLPPQAPQNPTSPTINLTISYGSPTKAGPQITVQQQPSLPQQQQQQQHHRHLHHSNLHSQPSGDRDDWDPSERLAKMDLDSGDSPSANPDSPYSKSTPTSSHVSTGVHTHPSEYSMSSPPQALQDPPLNSQPMDDQSTYFVVIYMDYVFPYLFPHYRPKILEGGRGWLLALLNHNKALFHTAVSFSSYLFAAIYNLENPEYQESTDILWRQLQERQAMALQELQQDMASLNTRGIHANLRESARALETILQLLVFDVSIGNMEHWELHLDAAMALFQQLVPDSDCWPEVISGLATGFSQFTPGNAHPMGTDLTAFRFFGGVLMYIDVVASTVLERRPVLQHYWARLLPCSTALIPLYSAPAPVQIENVMGCQNWMLKYIGEIAALDTWKKQEQRNGTFSMPNLVLQAQMIEQGIRKSAEALAQEDMVHDTIGASSAPSMVMPVHQVGCPLGRRKAQAFGDFGNKTRDLIPLTTQIWASAALVYLKVVVSGWKPSLADIKIAVLTTLNLLEQLPSPMFLQSVVWPYVMAGCLAPEELQNRFRMLEKNMGMIKVSETTRKAVAHMEEVWKFGDRSDDYDIAAALRMFGSPFLAM